MSSHRIYLIKAAKWLQENYKYYHDVFSDRITLTYMIRADSIVMLDSQMKGKYLIDKLVRQKVSSSANEMTQTPKCIY